MDTSPLPFGPPPPLLRQPYRSFPMVRLSIVRERCAHYGARRSIRHGGDAADLVRAILFDATREHFLAILLDAKHKLIGVHVASIGTVNNTIVHPREAFQAAIVANATALVVAHNHPSGDPYPSADDRSVTDRMRQAGQLLGIEVLDHIVVGDRQYYSFAEDRAVDLPGVTS